MMWTGPGSESYAAARNRQNTNHILSECLLQKVVVHHASDLDSDSLRCREEKEEWLSPLSQADLLQRQNDMIDISHIIKSFM